MTSKVNLQLNFDNILSLDLETTMKRSSLKVWSKQKRPETDKAFNMRVLTPKQKRKIFSILIIFFQLSALMTSNQPINNILRGTSIPTTYVSVHVSLVHFNHIDIYSKRCAKCLKPNHNPLYLKKKN